MINITARGFELKQGTKDGIEKELKRIEKMLPESAEFDVTLAKKKDGYRKLKTFLVDKKRKGGIDEIAKAVAPLDDITMHDFDQFDSSSVDIKRKKSISPNMMTDDEAIVQMEMLGHSFFVYLGLDGETKIIYKREKGYGLLICE